MVYISDAERDSAQQIIAKYANTIHPGDLLYIYVSSETMESVMKGMTVAQLIDRLYHNKSNLVSIPRREKLKKYDKIIEFNDAYKNMTIQDVLRDIAKISVEEKTENGDKQV